MPNIEWLTDSGLELDRGVVCDATLTTTRDPDILAAGDLASWPHPLADGDARPGRALDGRGRARPAGRPQRPRSTRPTARAHVAPPYFWSDQYDTKVQAVGFPGRAETLGDRRDRRRPARRRGHARRRARGGRRLQRRQARGLLSPPAAGRADRGGGAAMSRALIPPARRLGTPRSAGRVGTGPRHPLRRAAGSTTPSRGRDLDDQLFVASLGSKYSPADSDVRDVVEELEFLSERGRRRTFRCSGSATAGRCCRSPSAARSSRRPSPSSAGTRSRPTHPSSSGPGRGCSGTTTASRCRPGARALARSPQALQAFSHGASPRPAVSPREHDRDRPGLGPPRRRAPERAGHRRWRGAGRRRRASRRGRRPRPRLTCSTPSGRGRAPSERRAA